MQCLRQISATGSPTSPSPNIPTIWLSVNFDFLISDPQRNGSLYFQLVHLLGELTAPNNKKQQGVNRTTKVEKLPD
jgi:hypothetical protein